MRRDTHRLQLELLESRVMLAAADPGIDVSSESIAETAIVTNVEAHVDLLPFHQVLKISGPGHGVVTIDLSQLPDSIVNLQIRSFDSVTLIGEHSVTYLTLADIDHVDAGRISVGESLSLYGVEHVRIDVAPSLILVQGLGSLGLAVGEKTLLEVGRFNSPSYIWAWVENLGLKVADTASMPHVQIASYPSQSLLLSFDPQGKILTNINDVAAVDRGDFVRYFLASPDERTAQEQSHLVALKPVRVEHVSLSNLVGAFRLAFGDADTAPSRNVERLAGANEFELNRGVSDDESARVLQLLETDLDAHDIGTASTLGFEIETQQAAISLERIGSAADGRGQSTSFLETRSLSQPEGREIGDIAAALVSAAVGRLAEPLAQLAVSLQGSVSSFGEIVSASVDQNLRTDGRPALLVDTRGSRHRDASDVVVVNY